MESPARLVVSALNSNHLQRYFHVVRTAPSDCIGGCGRPPVAGRFWISSKS